MNTAPKETAPRLVRPHGGPDGLDASGVLQLWLEHHFRNDVRPRWSREMGFYASTDHGNDKQRFAQVRYYSGYNGGRHVEIMLREAAAKLDDAGASYEWKEGGYGFKYLLVELAD